MVSGCLALMISGTVACFTGAGTKITLTCSDSPVAGLETCKEQMTRLGGFASSSTSTIFVVVPNRQ